MEQIKLADFKERVINNDKPVLIDFSAVWCGPCGMMTPVLDQLSAEYKDKAEVLKIDFDEAADLAEEYGIMSVPTMMFFKGGQEIERVVGVTSGGELAARLDKLLG